MEERIKLIIAGVLIALIAYFVGLQNDSNCKESIPTSQIVNNFEEIIFSTSTYLEGVNEFWSVSNLKSLYSRRPFIGRSVLAVYVNKMCYGNLTDGEAYEIKNHIDLSFKYALEKECDKLE